MNTYSVRKISLNGVDIAAVDCNGIIIDDVQTALDLMMTVKYQAGVKAALDKIAFLEKLLADGLITKEEFDTRSSRIYVDGDGSKYSNSMESEKKVSISKYGLIVAFLPAAISAVLSAVAVIILTVVL